MTRTAAASPAVYREHPIKILRYSAKNLWLLIFPLLRSLRFYPFSFQNLIDWGAGVWFMKISNPFRSCGGAAVREKAQLCSAAGEFHRRRR